MTVARLVPFQSQVAPTIASVMVFGELAYNVGIPVMALAPKRHTGEEVDCSLLPSQDPTRRWKSVNLKEILSPIAP